MDKNSKEIIAEIRSAIDQLKARLLELEQRLSSLEEEAAAEPAQEVAAGPVDLSDAEIGIAEDLPEYLVEEAPAPEPEPEPAPEPEPIPEPEPMPIPEPEPVVAAPEPVVAAPEPVLTPEPVAEPPQPRPKARKPRISDAGRSTVPAWKTDKPGAPVKNIRSAISLYDRALFINTLFKEDYSLYDRTIADLNAMTSLDEAEEYLAERFPDWVPTSDVVYGFMMSVRKKLG